MKHNLQINFEPENARPWTHYKTFAMEKIYLTKISEQFIWKCGYVSDFMGTGEPGIMIHGSPCGSLVIPDENIGKNQEASYYTPREFYHYLIRRYSLDLYQDKRPLHLVACYSGAAMKNSGELSIAQKLANITQRKIWAYGGHSPVLCHWSGVVGSLNNNYFGVRGYPFPHRIKPKLIEPSPPVYMNRNNSITHC
ncbi:MULTISPECIES: hypothetical protein [unclassified Cedecea]|uniref:hypothetical protein n=1 Tax=unclassified Cedecea TaxID=2649846 RepID=UPI003017347B